MRVIVTRPSLARVQRHMHLYTAMVQHNPENPTSQTPRFALDCEGHTGAAAPWEGQVPDFSEIPHAVTGSSIPGGVFDQGTLR